MSIKKRAFINKRAVFNTVVWSGELYTATEDQKYTENRLIHSIDATMRCVYRLYTAEKTKREENKKATRL